MSVFNSLAFKFCPMCGERLSYTSYEGYCPYEGCHWNNDDSEGEATESTPPVQEAAIEVVAHPLAVDGGECPGGDFAEFNRLVGMADATIVVPLADWSRGGYVLAALANARAPLYPDRAEQVDLMYQLRFHAARCIGAGC